MDTMKDTKMQPAKSAVIEELRKVIADCYWPTSPVTINEILDRLEAAEKDVAIKEEVIDSLATVIKRLDAQCDAAEKEVDAMRAKIAEMERQESGFRERCTPSSPTGYSNRFPLYALPGAKGE